MDAKKTGALIAALRKEKEWSQTELAERLGVTNKAVSRWETGRGYPDVELLPKLSEVLDVSISELLEGERTPVPPKVDEQMAFLCQRTGTEKKKWKLLLAAVAALLLVLTPGLLRWCAAFVETIIGSPLCVVAEDYSSLSYYGETYVPLPLGDLECQIGEELVSEAQVEGAGFWGKLFFGESLYAVVGAEGYELVWLETDYDCCISQWFVLESKYDAYAARAAQAELDQLYGSYRQEDGNSREFSLDPSVLDALKQAEAAAPAEEAQWACPDWNMIICQYDESHLFCRVLGVLSGKDGSYFWSPQRYYELTGSTTHGLEHFPVEGELFPEA